MLLISSNGIFSIIVFCVTSFKNELSVISEVLMCANMLFKRKALCSNTELFPLELKNNSILGTVKLIWVT